MERGRAGVERRGGERVWSCMGVGGRTGGPRNARAVLEPARRGAACSVPASRDTPAGLDSRSADASVARRRVGQGIQLGGGDGGAPQGHLVLTPLGLQLRGGWVSRQGRVASIGAGRALPVPLHAGWVEGDPSHCQAPQSRQPSAPTDLLQEAVVCIKLGLQFMNGGRLVLIRHGSRPRITPWMSGTTPGPGPAPQRGLLDRGSRAARTAGRIGRHGSQRSINCK